MTDKQKARQQTHKIHHAGGFDHSILRRLIDPISQIGLAPRAFKKRLNAALIDRRFVAVERVARHAHHLTGLGHIPQFFGQVQQAGVVFDDLVGNIQHCGFLLMVRFAPPSKRATIISFKRCAAPFQLAEKGEVSDHITTNSVDPCDLG